MKLMTTVLIMATYLCALAQNDALPSGVYHEGKTTEVNNSVTKRQVIKGKTLDLSVLDIYTLTLAAGQTYIPLDGDKFERLIVVKNGTVKLILKDTAQTVGMGSIALVLAGDKISYQNGSGDPATWYVINYRSVDPVDIQRGQSAGPSFIKNWDQLQVNRSDKGESRGIFDRTTSMFGKFEVHATALNPGYASHDPHTHRVEELILMLTGNVLETIGHDKIPAQAGDCIFLASGILHRPINNGDKQCYYLAIQWHNLKTDRP